MSVNDDPNQMADLISELRRCLGGWDIAMQAADEIERLRAENAVLKNNVGWRRDFKKRDGKDA